VAPPSGDTREAGCNGCEEQDNRGSNNHPNGIAPRGVTAVLVNMVFDRAKGDEVDDHDSQGDQEGDEGHRRGEEVSQAVGADSEEERNASNSGSNLMEDEALREAM